MFACFLEAKLGFLAKGGARSQKHRVSTMYYPFGYSPKLIGAAVLVSGLIAGSVCAATTSTTSSVRVQTSTDIVNRINKGDRLPQAFNARQDQPILSSSSTKVPLGCDPAFSLVADPERGRIFGRCLT